MNNLQNEEPNQSFNDSKNEIFYFEMFRRIISHAEKWRFYCEKLNIPMGKIFEEAGN